VLSDTLPAGTTFVAGSCRYVDVAYPTGRIPCDDAPELWQQGFPTGKRVTTTFAVTVTAGTVNWPLVNRAYLTWNAERQELIATTTVVSAIPDFSQSYKTGPQEAERGDVVTYTILTVNSGDPVFGVVLSDPTSVGLVFARCRYGVAGDAVDQPCGEQPPDLWTLDVAGGGRITTTVAFTVTAGTLRWPTINCAALRTGDIQWHTVCADEMWVNPKAYLYLPMVLRNHPPTWRRAGGTAGVDFYDVSICPGDPLVQYAGTVKSGMYRSGDGGETWQHWALSGWATPVVVNPMDCNQAFVAVWGDGVHRVTGQNQTAPINQGLGNLYLYGLAISQDGATLYAGTDANGVYHTDAGSISWTAINSGIPDLRIRSLYMIGNDLYAGGRQCTYYHSTNGGASWQARPILDGGLGGACGDAQVWAIARVNGVLYASVHERGLHRSHDGGINWTPVTGVPATTTIYRFGLLDYDSRLYVGTFGHGVYTCAASGSCGPFPYGGLGTLSVRGLAVAEMGGDFRRIEAASNDGVWWIPLLP
jgi:uncharacterized repeat protein (TIGR01451 family)